MGGLASVVLFSHRIDAVVAFYRALGVALEGEDHGDGIVHHAADVGGVHMAVLPADENENENENTAPDRSWRAAGSTFVGVWVESLEQTTSALERLGAERLRSHEQCEWGCRTVFRDPDGRAVEVNQTGHCG